MDDRNTISRPATRQVRPATGASRDRRRAVAAGLVLGVLLAGAASVAGPGGTAAQESSTDDPVAAPPGADLCLAFDASRLTAVRWAAITEDVTAAVQGRTLVFPSPSIVATPDDGRAPDALGEGIVMVSVWAQGDAGPDAISEGCLVPQAEWSMVVSQALLQGSAARILESAGLPDDVSTQIDVEFYPDEERVRTTMRFTAAFGVGGTCWVDDVLSIDPAAGSPLASDEMHQDLHFLAPQDACTRFHAFMTDGAAGMLATHLMPRNLAGPGIGVRFVATSVDVRDGELVLAGSMDVGG